jgi:TRAP-type mannitol/chloroaromatic compound transport system permease small subunit
VKKLLVFIDSMNKGVGKAVSILPLLVGFAICYEIFARDILKSPTVWVSEGTVFACGLLYLLGGAWTLRQDGHVRVDVLYHGLSKKRKAIVDCLTYFAFLLYIAVMAWTSYHYMVQSVAVRETTMSHWNPPIWPIKIALFVSLVMLLLQQTAKFIRDLNFILGGEPL